MKLSTDRDSGPSPSDDEKTLGHGELLPDPDAHLSPEERAAIVRSICPKPLHPFIIPDSLANYSDVGPQTPLETRPPSDPVALPSLSYQLLRSNKHRQCQT